VTVTACRTIVVPSGAPLGTYTPVGVEDEVRVYAELIVYELDAERSEMWRFGAEHWTVERVQEAIVADVRADVAAAYHPRPVLLTLCTGEAVGLFGEPARVVDAQGVELFAPAPPATL
jgi:hypothetical protein